MKQDQPQTHGEDPDIWYGVLDPKKRKKIQDRLAQRARRKRLAEIQANAGDSTEQGVSSTPSLNNKRQTRPRMNGSSVPRSSIEGNQVVSNGLLPNAWYSALWKNGHMMGLLCSHGECTLSREFGEEIPAPLRPTILQRVTIHPTWIDRFPFPHMRDNIISLLGVVDPEEFIGDLFLIPSFTLEPGPVWDPKNWKIEKEFHSKWGYLFNPRLLDFVSSEEASSTVEISKVL